MAVKRGERSRPYRAVSGIYVLPWRGGDVLKQVSAFPPVEELPEPDLRDLCEQIHGMYKANDLEGMINFPIGDVGVRFSGKVIRQGEGFWQSRRGNEPDDTSTSAGGVPYKSPRTAALAAADVHVPVVQPVRSPVAEATSGARGGSWGVRFTAGGRRAGRPWLRASRSNRPC